MSRTTHGYAEQLYKQGLSFVEFTHVAYILVTLLQSASMKESTIHALTHNVISYF